MPENEGKEVWNNPDFKWDPQRESFEGFTDIHGVRNDDNCGEKPNWREVQNVQDEKDDPLNKEKFDIIQKKGPKLCCCG